MLGIGIDHGALDGRLSGEEVLPDPPDQLSQSREEEKQKRGIPKRRGEEEYSERVMGQQGPGPPGTGGAGPPARKRRWGTSPPGAHKKQKPAAAIPASRRRAEGRGAEERFTAIPLPARRRGHMEPAGGSIPGGRWGRRVQNGVPWRERAGSGDAGRRP